jgi:hypothetical protein
MREDASIPGTGLGLSEAFSEFLQIYRSDLPLELGPVRDGPVREAEQKFRDYLCHGAIRAFKRDPESGEWLALSPHDWAGENWIPGFWDDFIGGDNIEPGPNTLVRGGPQVVFFDRDEFNGWVRTLRPTPSNLALKSSSRAQHECERRFKQLMRDSPNSRPKPKAEIIKDARNQITGLSERAALRAWHIAIGSTGATAWSSPGAPKKSKHP